MLEPITPTTARRIAIMAQHLAGAYPQSSPQAIMETLQQIRCLQLDPIRAVERTQYLVLWSRLGYYNRQDLHDLVYEQRLLFEYWAHAASIVLTEDYPLHEYMMRQYGEGGSSWSRRLTAWVQENQAFRDYILEELAEGGPKLTKDFENRADLPWASGGWTSGRSVAYMIDYLWSRGQVMVAKRDGLKRWWDLAERVLPSEELASGWSAAEVTRDAVQKSLKALGVGRTRDIERHFIERRYPELDVTMADLLAQEVIYPIEIMDEATDEVTTWPGEWFIHRDTLPLLA